MTLLAASIPPVSKEFYDKLEASFPRVDPVPNITTMDEIMHGAGQQSVLDWVRAHAVRTSVITSADVSRTVNIRAR